VAYACKKAPIYAKEERKFRCSILEISIRAINACLLSEAISKFMFWCDQNLEKASRWSKKSKAENDK